MSVTLELGTVLYKEGITGKLSRSVINKVTPKFAMVVRVDASKDGTENEVVLLKFRRKQTASTAINPVGNNGTGSTEFYDFSTVELDNRYKKQVLISRIKSRHLDNFDIDTLEKIYELMRQTKEIGNE